MLSLLRSPVIRRVNASFKTTNTPYTRRFTAKATPNNDVPLDQLPLRQRFRMMGKLYGRTSLAVYLGMSTTTFTCIFVAIWNGIDVERHVLKVKQKLGWATEEQVAEEGATEFEKQASDRKTGFSLERVGTTFLVAFGANKLLSPLKVFLTVMVTPSIARWWKRLGRK